MPFGYFKIYIFHNVKKKPVPKHQQFLTNKTKAQRYSFYIGMQTIRLGIVEGLFYSTFGDEIKTKQIEIENPRIVGSYSGADCFLAFEADIANIRAF